MRWAVATVLPALGCIHETVQTCGTVICPTDAVCMIDQCVSAAAVAACAGKPDATPCSDLQLPVGVCGKGVCIAPGCGNGVLEPGEVCDDGNTVGGDGCSADCEAIDLCPPIGTTPRYSRVLRQPIVQDCNTYSSSNAAGIATVTCDVMDSGGGIFEGPIDGPLAVVPNMNPDGNTVYFNAQLAPEGDELWVMVEPVVSTATVSWAYQRAGDGTWVQAHELSFPTNPLTRRYGRPTRGPIRRVMTMDVAGGAHELVVDAAGATTEVAAYSPSDLGVITVGSAPNLTPDGLRMIFSSLDGNGISHDYYSDRRDLASRFRLPDVVVAPTATDPFMTEDCARLYSSAFQSILYVQQVP